MKNKDKFFPKNTNGGMLMQKQSLAMQVSSGPIPTPEDLAKYESVHPGISNIILDTYQKQVNHRIEIENSVIKQNGDLAKKGQVFAFIIYIITIGFGFLLIYKGKDIIGIVAVVSALAALCGVFITGKYQEGKERINKAKQIPEQ